MTATIQDDLHPVILEALGVTKLYGAQVALKDVTFCVRRGAVNVLIGENGAGKSTLMRLIAGAEQATAGNIVVDGKTLQFRSPRDAAAAGIAIVHQELAVLDNLNVAENIFAGRELLRAGILVDQHNEELRSGVVLHHVGMPMNIQSMRIPTEDLSLGCRQLVELARSLAHGARILILDEPTSALSEAEAETLFGVIEELKASGVAVVYISHRLHELLHLGDYFTVLRDGRIVGEGVRGAVDRGWIVERMSGRSLDTLASPGDKVQSAQVVLDVKDLSVRRSGRPQVDGVSLTVREGEVVGIYGLLGSGRTELLETLAGLDRPDKGVVKVNGKQVPLTSVAASIRAGITLAPEDRQKDSLLPGLSIRENISLAALDEFSHYGFLVRSEEAAQVKRVAAQVQNICRGLGASCHHVKRRQSAKGRPGSLSNETTSRFASRRAHPRRGR